MLLRAHQIEEHSRRLNCFAIGCADVNYSSSRVGNINHRVIVTERNRCHFDVFLTKVFDLNKLIVKATSLIYSKTLLEIEQENPVSFVLTVLFAIFVYKDFIKRLELTIDQFIFHFEKLIFE